MVSNDLKVEYASVNVSNANDENCKYRIAASFNTRDGKVTSVNGGSVIIVETGVQVSNFSVNYEYQNSISYTFIGQIEKQTKDDVINLIDEFVAIAIEKSINEAAE